MSIPYHEKCDREEVYDNSNAIPVLKHNVPVNEIWVIRVLPDLASAKLWNTGLYIDIQSVPDTE